MSATHAESPTAVSGSDASGSASDPSHSSSGAAADDSGQSRQLHAGHNPAAIAGANAADGPPPAARLYRHALESIFAFLSKVELAFALRVSRGWLAAVGSMRRLELQISLWRPRPPRTEIEPALSAMGRHVSEIEDLVLRGATLSVLASGMGHLRALMCMMPRQLTAEPLAFPAKLRRLTLHLSRDVDAAQVNAAVAAIGRLTLLEDLSIHFYTLGPEISLEPLTALPRVRSLGVHGCGNGFLSDAQVDELRTMPHLLQLSLSKMTTSTLRRLLRRPHGLRWQDISLPNPLDDEAAALLPQLASLTRIAGWAACSRFDWLRGLPNLTEVDLTFEGPQQAGRAESLVAGLQCCTNIEILELSYCSDVAAAHLADLLPRLRRLRELWLDRLSIVSLSFLSQPPLTDQLTCLHLNYCRQLPLSELRHVHALRGLKQLELLHSFDERLDDHSCALYEPPSTLFPRLETFEYSAPARL